MRPIEQINRELVAAKKQLSVWESRVNSLRSEQRDVLDSLNKRCMESV